MVAGMVVLVVGRVVVAVVVLVDMQVMVVLVVHTALMELLGLVVLLVEPTVSIKAVGKVVVEVALAYWGREAVAREALLAAKGEGVVLAVRLVLTLGRGVCMAAGVELTQVKKMAQGVQYALFTPEQPGYSPQLEPLTRFN
jgi:hypothetical protein